MHVGARMRGCLGMPTTVRFLAGITCNRHYELLASTSDRISDFLYELSTIESAQKFRKGFEVTMFEEITSALRHIAYRVLSSDPLD